MQIGEVHCLQNITWPLAQKQNLSGAFHDQVMAVFDRQEMVLIQENITQAK